MATRSVNELAGGRRTLDIIGSFVSGTKGTGAFLSDAFGAFVATDGDTGIGVPFTCEGLGGPERASRGKSFFFSRLRDKLHR